MSADNFYLVRKHPSGGFAAVMGLASDENDPAATEYHGRFDTPEDALTFALDDYTEYGASIHPECLD